MNKTSTFNFMGNELRVVQFEGNPWFVAKDVLDILELVRGGTTLASLDSGDVTTIHKGVVGSHHKGNPMIRIISESGLYRLVMRCDKWEARAFQDWVTKIVLPAIRKDGAYIKDEEKVATGEMSEDEFVLKALTILQKKVERITKERDEAIKKLNTMDVGVYCREILHRYPTHSLSVRLGQRAF